MGLQILEWMALIVVAIGIIKLLVILINPKKWASVVSGIYGNPALTTIISVILGTLTLNYLLEELTIVQIFASMLFFTFLMLIGIAAYGKDMAPVVNKILKDRNILKRGWFAIALWIFLIIWVLYSILS
ncbi:MAG: hypothetical protein Q8Q31_02360 [Nanoarchaeota archaeon]|nr:hypothetical protein [Nanoarchaeota archaeon]